MSKPPRVHAVIIALNEEDFIRETIRPLYDHCCGISVVTQYDRNYYGDAVNPDRTAELVLNYPDPEGKIHLVVRRHVDETWSRNEEMLALTAAPAARLIPHAVSREELARRYAAPDYFLIVDADEIYDRATVPAIWEYLGRRRPRGMRVSAYEYGHTWNRRVPPEVYLHHHFGFVRAGVLFQCRRQVTFNEFRLKKLLGIARLPDRWAARFYGFIDCPLEIGMFHHAAYVRRGRAKLLEKVNNHSHREEHITVERVDGALRQRYDSIATSDLPENVRTGEWPPEFFDEPPSLQKKEAT